MAVNLEDESTITTRKSKTADIRRRIGRSAKAFGPSPDEHHATLEQEGIVSRRGKEPKTKDTDLHTVGKISSHDTVG